MAVKDHSLDSRIVEAATAEFMEHGYRKASLRKIAARAGLTTGALYTRYENKDVLFTSLVEEALGQIGAEFLPLQQLYMEARQRRDPQTFLEVIRKEEQIYLDLLFRYYDQCVLFFCRSDGSSVAARMEALMEEKARQTVDFFRSISKNPEALEGVEIILSGQFQFYRKILERGCGPEKAVRCMRAVEQFMEAGWKDLFERIL